MLVHQPQFAIILQTGDREKHRYEVVADMSVRFTNPNLRSLYTTQHIESLPIAGSFLKDVHKCPQLEVERSRRRELRGQCQLDPLLGFPFQ